LNTVYQPGLCIITKTKYCWKEYNIVSLEWYRISTIYHTLSDCRSLACGPWNRRIRADLIEVYKIIPGLSNVKFLTFFEYSDEHRTRGHSLKLQKHRSCLDLRQHFFSERVINVWNKLYGNTVTAPTLNCFKRHLETLHKDESFTRLCQSVWFWSRASSLGRPHPVSYPVSTVVAAIQSRISHYDATSLRLFTGRPIQAEGCSRWESVVGLFYKIKSPK